MNPRRVHELISKHFPEEDAASRDWTNVMERDGVRTEALAALIKQHIDADEVLVEVHRKLGDYLPIEDALLFIRDHIGEGEIKVTDREFKTFVVVARNGVATGWAATSNTPLDSGAVRRST
jgi:hypothetical protein